MAHERARGPECGANRVLVFIAGQATGLMIYFRNLYLIYRERALALSVQPGKQ